MGQVLYSVVIPVYNSMQSLVELTSRINGVFRDQVAAANEIIFVDDCSPNPDTWPTLIRIHSQNSNVKIVQLTRNFGQQGATMCGFSEAEGDYIITMDDDLQHIPEEIPNLISERDHDIVIAQFGKKEHSQFKKITSKIKGWFDYKLIGKPQNLQMSSFRLVKRNLVDCVLNIASPYPFVPALLFLVSKDIVGVKATHAKRAHGKGNYNLRKLFLVFSNLLINNSSLLLQVIGFLGVVIAFLSFLLVFWVIVQRTFYHVMVSGWASVMTAVLFLGGVTLFGIGVVGEYLIRIIATVERKPSYWVRQKLEKTGQ